MLSLIKKSQEKLNKLLPVNRIVIVICFILKEKKLIFTLTIQRPRGTGFKRLGAQEVSAERDLDLEFLKLVSSLP